MNKKEKKEEYFFDSANIAESYSGIVLPLTYTFAELVYQKAYTDLLVMSGVSKQKIKKHSYVFKNLLGHFNGRMFYNMNNWYKMAAFIPGYKRNKSNLEGMITSNVREEIDLDIKPFIWLKIFYPFIVFAKVIFFGFTSRYFSFVVNKEIKFFQSYVFDSLSLKDCKELFEKIKYRLLNRWYVTLENDFFVMTYYGLLKKFVSEEKLQELIKFQSVATKQVFAIASLSKKMQKIADLWGAIERDDYLEFSQIISMSPEIEKELGIYLDKFGDRFASELKLESEGVKEDIKNFIPFLKAYKDYDFKKINSSIIDVDLPFFKKILYKLILRKFNKYGKQREKFRLVRSNAFAIARKIFKRMGKLFFEQGIIEKANDIFYLSLQEVLNTDLASGNTFLKLVKERKSQYLSYEKMHTPVHFSTKDGLIPQDFDAKKPEIRGNLIKAIPASGGVIKGKIKIFKDFYVPSNIDFDILVTSHTDPGWTALIALSKGLIVEYGGILSHASIVARELGIPAVIGAKGIMEQLKNGQIVEIDGSKGTIKIIN